MLSFASICSSVFFSAPSIWSTTASSLISFFSDILSSNWSLLCFISRMGVQLFSGFIFIYGGVIYPCYCESYDRLREKFLLIFLFELRLFTRDFATLCYYFDCYWSFNDYIWSACLVRVYQISVKLSLMFWQKRVKSIEKSIFNCWLWRAMGLVIIKLIIFWFTCQDEIKAIFIIILHYSL